MTSFITSERGKDILVDNFQCIYHKNGLNKGGTKIYWEMCCKKNRDHVKHDYTPNQRIMIRKF